MGGRYESELWAQLADKARAAAKRVRDPDLRLRVLLVAARYLVWAKKSKRSDPLRHDTSHRPGEGGGAQGNPPARERSDDLSI